uniref:LIM zinc-binding domain-containing protein n=1 Tax=Varanus komodoensis TaxID=61221 RepID=A0A8D2LI56_VARKO
MLKSKAKQKAMLAAPKAKSNKDGARFLTPSSAAALSFQGAAREECAVCSEPLHPTRRISVQNASLHHACFCCVRCGKMLSLLDYATFCGAFYCKAHYKLLAVVKESSQVPPV